jgi:hypothetical protein
MSIAIYNRLLALIGSNKLSRDINCVQLGNSTRIGDPDLANHYSVAITAKVGANFQAWSGAV